MKPHTLRTTLFALAIAAGPFTAFAEEGEIVIRANRLSAYRGDAAFAVTDLAPDALRRASLDQALKRETQASLFRRQSSLTANPTIQGISLRAIGPSGAGRALVPAQRANQFVFAFVHARWALHYAIQCSQTPE